jgi:hypothetical protein
MAQCPYCQTDKNPEPLQGHCVDCGKLLSQPAATPEPVMGTRQAAGSPNTSRVTTVGDGNLAVTHNTTNTTNNLNALEEYCATEYHRVQGGLQVFQCPACHKRPVCEWHFDQVRKLCLVCVEET